MVKNAITVFARVKPEASRKGLANYKIHRRPKKHSNEDFLVLTAPQKFAEYIDNRPESWNFSFNRIFGHGVPQDDVFDSVARPVVNRVFDGYNATIFAYGQTGSGKTYTITGEPGVHSERGILPRTLQYVFDIVRKNPENLYSVEVAYLEIYNENGYDLLLERKQREAAGRLEDLPRVTIQEDESGTMHLKNLSFRTVENEKEALQYLVDGDMYRAISETPMNPRSSRSHCIFTIVVSVKKIGEDRYNRAKMHLVDLAGSERVYKCSIQGTILTEAKHINLSLHFLEQVIVCLGQDNVSHVPYRNSLLTSILRDSLGGNCLTTMIATLSVSTFNLEETISTCRFAQRVAIVKNDVNLTFELDTKSENMLLRMENERLRKQIEELKNQALGPSCATSAGSLEYYKNLVVQRDQEISRLIDILKKERRREKTAIKEPPHHDLSEVRRDQRSTQIPSNRASPRTIYQTSPTMLKKRGHGNSLQRKLKMTPRRDGSVSPKTTKKNQPAKRSPRYIVTEVPDLDLKEDNVDIMNVGLIQDSQDDSNVASQIDTKTKRKETTVLDRNRRQNTETLIVKDSQIKDNQKSRMFPDINIVPDVASFGSENGRSEPVASEGNRRQDTQTLNIEDYRINHNQKSQNLPEARIDSDIACHSDARNESEETVVLESLKRQNTQTLSTKDSRFNHYQKSQKIPDAQFDSDLAYHDTKNGKIETAVLKKPRRQNTQTLNIEDSRISHNQKSKNLLDPEIDANTAYHVDSKIERRDTIASGRHRQQNTKTLNIEDSTLRDNKESKKLPDSHSKSIPAYHNSTKTDGKETVVSESPRQQSTQTLYIGELTTNQNKQSKQHPAVSLDAKIASRIDSKSEGRETVESERHRQQNTQTLNTDESDVNGSESKIKKSVDIQDALELSLANANLSNRRELSNAAQNTQTPRQKELSANDADKAEWNAVPKINKIVMNEKSPRVKTPGLGFPRNVMKMIRTSRNRHNEDSEETTSPKSGSPRSGFKAPSIIRNMLCRDKTSLGKSPTRIDDKKPNPSSLNQYDPKISGNFKNLLPLTGDPEIDEEIIAFYKAKRSGGIY